MKTLLVAFTLIAAPAVSLHSQSPDQEQNCQYCASIECGGVPCGYGCVVGGVMFEGCTATIHGCSGQSCGSARVLVPIIEQLAGDPTRRSEIQALVRRFGSTLRWSKDDPAVLEVYGCDNTRIAAFKLMPQSASD